MAHQTTLDTATPEGETTSPADDNGPSISRVRTFDDKDERDEEMESAQEEWVDELVAAIQDARGSEMFQEWAEAVSQFHEYSYRNQLLIKLQMPGATRVAGFNTWANDFDRYVQEGEDAIWIWRPNTITARKCPDCGQAPGYHKDNEDLDCPRADSSPEDWDCNPSTDWKKGEILCGFVPAPVFDVSQTEGEQLPELDTSVSGDADGLVEAAEKAAKDLGAVMEVVPTTEWGRKGVGVCDLGADQPEIRIVEQSSKADMTNAAIHEIAHGLLHSEDMRVSVDNDEVHEVEAEAVSYVVGQHFGLDMDGSAAYIAAWSNDEEEVLKQRLKRINSAATEIIEAIEAHQ